MLDRIIGEEQMGAFDQGYALVVGIGADLPDTVNDAVGLADNLRDPARCAYPPAQVCLLTGEDADREHILAVFQLFRLEDERFQRHLGRGVIPIIGIGRGLRLLSRDVRERRLWLPRALPEGRQHLNRSFES